MLVNKRRTDLKSVVRKTDLKSVLRVSQDQMLSVRFRRPNIDFFFSKINSGPVLTQ